MDSTRLRRCAAIASLLFVAACGGDDDSATGENPVDTDTEATVDGEGSVDVADSVQVTTEPEVTAASATSEASEAAGEACALLDDAFLDETFAGQTGTFGEPYDFQPGLPSPDGRLCTWKDGSTGLSLRLGVEDAATSETDDHSGRAYNIDVEPAVEPQDGPGENSVLLVDRAFDDVGGGGFPYGFFFVQDDTAVFVETVGLDIGAEGLRTLADEAAARLAAS